MRSFRHRVETVLRSRRGDHRAAVLGAALALPMSALAGSAAAQVLADDLLYTSVQPCRVFNTRLQAAGALAANSPRAFTVVGSSNFAAQGGESGGCGIPGFNSRATATRRRT